MPSHHPPIVLSIPSSQSHRVDHDESAVLGFDRHDLERNALRVRTEEEDQVRVIPILVRCVERVLTVADGIPHTIPTDAVSSSRRREVDVWVIVHILSDKKKVSSLTERER